jgi:hypothetical protein
VPWARKHAAPGHALLASGPSARTEHVCQRTCARPTLWPAQGQPPLDPARLKTVAIRYENRRQPASAAPAPGSAAALRVARGLQPDLKALAEQVAEGGEARRAPRGQGRLCVLVPWPVCRNVGARCWTAVAAPRASRRVLRCVSHRRLATRSSGVFRVLGF